MSRKLHLQVRAPFCNHKCSHCSTLTCDYRFGITEPYNEALIREAQAAGASYPEYEVSSINISGGSPACLEAHRADKLLRELRKSFNLAENCSIGFKITPGILSYALLNALRSRGATRFDLSLQTTNPAEHQLLNRPYSYESLDALALLIKSYPFTGLSIRLLVGIPGQTERSLERSLQNAIHAKPDQIVLTPLNLVRGTELFRKCEAGVIAAKTSAETETLYACAVDLLDASGYQPYTHWHFCIPGKQDPSALQRLQDVDELGLGLGAVSRVDGLWYHNTTNLKEYVEHSAEPELCIKNISSPTTEISSARKLMLGLSTPPGVNANQWPNFEDWFSQAAEDGNLSWRGKTVHLTPQGAIHQEALFKNLMETAAGLSTLTAIQTEA